MITFQWDMQYLNRVLDWTAGKELFEDMSTIIFRPFRSRIMKRTILYKKLMQSFRVTILFNGKLVVSSGSYKESRYPWIYNYLQPRLSDSPITGIGSERSHWNFPVFVDERKKELSIGICRLDSST